MTFLFLQWWVWTNLEWILSSVGCGIMNDFFISNFGKHSCYSFYNYDPSSNLTSKISELPSTRSLCSQYDGMWSLPLLQGLHFDPLMGLWQILLCSVVIWVRFSTSVMCIFLEGTGCLKLPLDLVTDWWNSDYVTGLLEYVTGIMCHELVTVVNCRWHEVLPGNIQDAVGWKKKHHMRVVS